MENAASTEKEKETVVERVTNTLATPLAGFATFLYATWQLVVEQQLFLRTFLVERMGKRRDSETTIGVWERTGIEDDSAASAFV